ncbi:hypothetical protein [Nocardia bhagyanarayanae]|uniref:hypothetical protein n=1 Tax=Nocardia bhagyanarayanae TaxID=1215925 RepID=UPI001FE6566C|nr:hypothetical protein [Nocardia bhagyanarayanae]
MTSTPQSFPNSCVSNLAPNAEMITSSTTAVLAKIVWTVDIIAAPAALLLALLASAGQSVRYAPGRMVAVPTNHQLSKPPIDTTIEIRSGREPPGPGPPAGVRYLSLRQIGGRAAQDLVLLLEQPDPAAGIAQLGGLAARSPRLVPIIDIGLADPFRQRHRMDPEIGRDLLQRDSLVPVAGDPHDVIAKLFRIRLGHCDILSDLPLGKPSRLSPALQQPHQAL